MTSFKFEYKLINKHQIVEQFACEVATKGEANALNHIVESVVNELYPLSDGYRFLSGSQSLWSQGGAASKEAAEEE